MKAWDWEAWQTHLRLVVRSLQSVASSLALGSSTPPNQDDTLKFCQMLAERAAVDDDESAGLMLHITLGMLGTPDPSRPATGKASVSKLQGGGSLACQETGGERGVGTGALKGKDAPLLGVKRRAMVSQQMLYL